MLDAATNGRLLPWVRVDKACPGLMLPSYRRLSYWNTHSVCGLGFNKVAYAIGGVMRGVDLLEDTLMTTRLLKNHFHGQ